MRETREFPEAGTRIWLRIPTELGHYGPGTVVERIGEGLEARFRIQLDDREPGRTVDCYRHEFSLGDEKPPGPIRRAREYEGEIAFLSDEITRLSGIALDARRILLELRPPSCSAIPEGYQEILDRLESSIGLGRRVSPRRAARCDGQLEELIASWTWSSQDPAPRG